MGVWHTGEVTRCESLLTTVLWFGLKFQIRPAADTSDLIVVSLQIGIAHLSLRVILVTGLAFLKGMFSFTKKKSYLTKCVRVRLHFVANLFRLNVQIS